MKLTILSLIMLLSSMSGSAATVFETFFQSEARPIFSLKDPSVRLRASRTKVYVPCAIPKGCCGRDGQRVNLWTEAKDFGNKQLTYSYIVSGGRIEGTGSDVTWDLTGAQPGTYTVTVKVAESERKWASATIAVTVENCSDCGQASACPTASLEAASEKGFVAFAIYVSSSAGDVSYNWSISAGTINSGQGTRLIVVDTRSLGAGNTVTATVQLGGGNFQSFCQLNFTESVVSK